MGRPFKGNKRYIGEDGLWYYKCYGCEQFCPEYDITNNKNKPFGKDIYCKPCKKLRRKPSQRKIITQTNKQYNTSWVEPMGRHLNLKGLTDEDKTITIKFFNNLNYNTNEPIYKQFQKRIEEKYGVILDMDDIPYQEKEDNGL